MSNSDSAKLITKMQYCKSTNAQAYFWWHSLKRAKDELSVIAEDEVMHEINFDNWDEEFIRLVPREISERFSHSMQKIKQWLLKRLQSEYQCVAVTGNKEERVAKTLALIKSNLVLLNPAFTWQGGIAEPFAYNAKTNTIINFKFSSKVKRRDFLGGYYDYSIVSQVTPVENYELWLPRQKDYRKFEIDLRPTEWGVVTQTGKAPNLKQGDKEMMFIEAFTRGAIDIKKGSKKAEYVPFPDVTTRLTTIDLARNVTKPDLKSLTDDLSEYWGANAEWVELLKKMNSPYYGFSGKVYPKKIIANHPLALTPEAPLPKLLSSIDAPYVDQKRIAEFVDIGTKKLVVWYDFEGYALPFAPLDYAQPFQQIVFQVSVIKTTQNSELSKTNLVLDPKKLTVPDFHQIIDAIYDQNAQAYVVYNKSYELTRLKEMHQMLERIHDANADAFYQKYLHIVEHTIDLYDCFKISSPNIIPPILLHDQRGRASIKNVELHINQNHIKMPRPIRKYYDLNVPNGTIAMTYAIDRALGISGDEEWARTTHNLKTYCENDVRAMIMTYDYIVMKAKA